MLSQRLLRAAAAELQTGRVLLRRPIPCLLSYDGVVFTGLFERRRITKVT